VKNFITKNFITVVDKRNHQLVTINVRYINTVTPDGDNTHIGINNYGALGYKVEASYETVLDMIRYAQGERG
jgi:hypothetical protein